jgi:hypothetical protein
VARALGPGALHLGGSAPGARPVGGEPPPGARGLARRTAGEGEGAPGADRGPVRQDPGDLADRGEDVGDDAGLRDEPRREPRVLVRRGGPARGRAFRAPGPPPEGLGRGRRGRAGPGPRPRSGITSARRSRPRRLRTRRRWAATTGASG